MSAAARLAMASALLGLACGEVPQGGHGELRLESEALQSASAGLCQDSMAYGRREHTATLLPSGKVLVVGGRDSDGTHASAELYDPDTGQWTVTGRLLAARHAHTATLLQSGKVLVIGGMSSEGTALTSAELYDPGTGEFTPTGTLGSARLYHTATLLKNGKVLVVGGRQGYEGGALDTSEVYDPGTGLFTPTGTLAEARSLHTATLLPSSGKVLVVGGRDDQYYGRESTEEYDPDTGAWTTRASMGNQRYNHTATLLPSGQVLVAGGQSTHVISAPWDDGLYSRLTVELYNPGSNRWTSVEDLHVRRTAHTATLLPSGQVLVAGGQLLSRDSFDKAPLNTTEAYESGKGWTAMVALTTPRFQATATLLPSGQVLVTGGWDGRAVHSTAEVFDPGGALWSANPGSLSQIRLRHTATLLPSGKVLAAGGEELTGAPFDSAELYAPEAGTGQSTLTIPLLTARSRHTATLLVSGEVLVAGGLGTSGAALDSAELYTPGEPGQFTPTGRLLHARSYHTATLLPGGKVLVAGGQDSPGGALSYAEVYDPATGQWTVTGSLNQARSHHTATLLPGGRVLVVGGQGPNGSPLDGAEVYDPRTARWAVVDSLTHHRSQHTATLLPNGKVLVAGGLRIDGVALASAELYTPGSGEGAWTSTGSLSNARFQHTATLLMNGQVLVAGGRSSGGATIDSAEVYDPATGIWVPAGTLVRARSMHTATLLPSGQVLATGGGSFSTEVYDSTGARQEWRARINPLNVRSPGEQLSVTGTGLRGLSEASSGNTQGSATDFPLLSLMAIEGGALTRIGNPVLRSDTEVAVEVPTIPDGHYILSVVSNAIPSGQVIRVDGAPLAAPSVAELPPLVTEKRPTIEGTAGPHRKVFVWLNGTAEGPVTVGDTGHWSYTPSRELLDGYHQVKATATDELGNVSPDSESRSFRIDTMPPGVPEVTPPEKWISIAPKEWLTNTATPTIQGTAEPGSTVTVWLDGTAQASTEVDAEGRWSFTPAALSDKKYELQAHATDEALHESARSAALYFTVDTVAPDAPALTSPGPLPTTRQPLFSGTAEPNSTVTVSLTLEGTTESMNLEADADASGSWSITPTQALEFGDYSVSVTAKDDAGNESPPAENHFAIQRSHYGWSCAAAPSLPATWALVTLALSLGRRRRGTARLPPPAWGPDVSR